MPRRQVYGKRSRAIYGTLTDFLTPPPKCSSGDGSEVAVLKVEAEFSRLEIKDGLDERDNGGGGRRVMKEKDVNEVVNRQVVQPEKVKRRQRARRRIVDDGESSEEEETKQDQTMATHIARDTLSNHGPIQLDTPPTGEVEEVSDRTLHNEHRSRCLKAEADNVSLQVEGHHRSTTTPRPDHKRHPSAAKSPSIATTHPRPAATNKYTEHCSQLLALSSHELTEFSEWSDQLSSHFHITKIAEASFGEVYRLSLLEDLPDFSKNDESVLKVIAIRPPDSTLPSTKRKREEALKKIEAMSRPEDVANEIRLLQRMSTIPGFTNFREVRVVQGRPSPTFARAFKAYNAEQKARKKDPSHFPDPARKTSYADDQLWAIIEMQDAGTDLERSIESGACASIWLVWDVFWQTVLSLAKGEEGAEFEHRDLHLGNICIRHRRPGPTDAAREIDPSRKLNFTAAETTIIDYTLSRACMPDATVAYHDLTVDEALFEGDGSEEYQYEIYRYMRGAAMAGDAYADATMAAAAATVSNGDDDGNSSRWEQFHPVTNLVWLHFVLYELLEQVEWPSATKAPAASGRSKSKVQERERWNRAGELERLLLRVQEMLDPGALCSENADVRSASDLVAMALGEGWLDVEDIVGEGVEERGDHGNDHDSEELSERFGGMDLHDEGEDDDDDVIVVATRGSSGKK